MGQGVEAPLAFCSRPPSCLALLGAEKVDLDNVREVFDDEARNLQSRLREQLSQLQIESGLFLRLMYKNKSQHRRTLYYQRLSEVRRDLQMLSKSGLDKTVEGFAKFFTNKRPDDVSSKAVTQSKFKDAIDESKALRSLLSAARLLNQSDGPIMAGGAQLAGLLRQSFFMPFALTMFSCLARFRVLLLQVLYEVITAFNLLSTAWQQKQKSLIYSVHGKSVSSSALGRGLPAELECQWDGVKLSMTERRTASFSDRREAVSDVTFGSSQLWFVDDRTGVKCDLQVPVAIAGPSGERLGAESQVPLNKDKDISNTPDPGKIEKFGPFSDVRSDVCRADPKEDIARPSAEDISATKETKERVKYVSGSSLAVDLPKLRIIHDGGSSGRGQVTSTNSDYRHDSVTSAAVKSSVAYRSISHKIIPNSIRTGNIVQNLQTGLKRNAADISVDQEGKKKSRKILDSHNIIKSSVEHGHDALPDSVRVEYRADRIPSILLLSSNAGATQMAESAFPNQELKSVELYQKSNVQSRHIDTLQDDGAGGSWRPELKIEREPILRPSAANLAALEDSRQIANSELSATFEPNTENCRPDFIVVQTQNTALHDDTNQGGPSAAERSNGNVKNEKTSKSGAVDTGCEGVMETPAHKNERRCARPERSIALPSIRFNTGSAELHEAGASDNDYAQLPQRAESQPNMGQSVERNKRAPSAILQPNSSSRKKKPVTHASIRSDTQAPPNKIENAGKRRPQVKQITDSEKRQQSTSRLHKCSAKSKLKRGKGDDGKSRTIDSESQRKKANDIFAMLLGGSD